jgi:hypothetical protein
VEWQFYLLLPLAVALVWKLFPGRRALGVALAFAALGSLLLSLWLTQSKPMTAFFLLPPRAWEMLAGGLVYLVGDRYMRNARVRKGCEAAGMLLIAAAVLLLDSGASWPGWRALVPVAGTALVLMAARDDSLWTGSRLAQWLGNCSYSVYLWHWPLVVGITYLELDDSPLATVLALALTLVLGQLSYLFVENRSRLWLTPMRLRSASLLLAGAAALVIGPSLYVQQQGGIAARMPARANALFDAARDRNPRMDECLVSSPAVQPGCTYGGPVLGAIVLGDSHAASVMRVVEQVLPSTRQHVLDWSMTGCPTLLGVHSTLGDASGCRDFLASALSSQRAWSPAAPLIIVNRTALYFDGLFHALV